MIHKKSHDLFSLIENLIPGGVNSPFRSFNEVGGQALFMSYGQGSSITDIDGNEYIDYVGAWGPLILGHRPSCVIKALHSIVENVMVTGAPHILEYEFALKITQIMPSIAKIRFVNSGTESCMSALRLARGYTGRDLVLMFEGGYHGHIDITLASYNHQSSEGIPANVKGNTLMARYNDIESVAELFKKFKDKIAAVIIEPVAGSMSVVKADLQFLKDLRQICFDNNTVLIFDEVLTGLRLALGGAQGLYNIEPDITCLGKILGGGMPIGAYGGRADIMDYLMPNGQVYQAGTFSGNPLSMACGLAIVGELQNPDIYRKLENLGHYFENEFNSFCKKMNYPVLMQRVGSMFSITFSSKAVFNFADSEFIDKDKFAEFFHKVLAQGVYLPPSAYDAACFSYAHSDNDIAKTLEIFKTALKEIFA